IRRYLAPTKTPFKLYIIAPTSFSSVTNGKLNFDNPLARASVKKFFAGNVEIFMSSDFSMLAKILPLEVKSKLAIFTLAHLPSVECGFRLRCIFRFFFFFTFPFTTGSIYFDVNILLHVGHTLTRAAQLS
ncbi:MAG: hypothetical protein QME68_08355, partial [Elusimicrobiota bacterium]|nr:hypothetical protein [Elusimicrobiota bacterium]